MLSKRVVTSLCSLLFAFSLILTACGGQNLGAKEAIGKAIEASMNMKSYSFTAQLKLDIDPPESSIDEFGAEFATYLQDLELQIDGIYHDENLQTEMTIQLDVAGMSFTVPMVVTEEKLWLKLPDTSALGFPLPPELTEKFIELDFEELNQMSGLVETPSPVTSDTLDVDQMKNLANELFDVFTSHYDEDEFFAISNGKDVSLPQGIDAQHVVKMTITNENLETALNTFMNQVLPEILDLLAKPEWAETFQVDPSELDALKQEIDQNKQEVMEEIGKIKESLHIHDFSMITALDKDYNTPYQEINIDVDITDEGETGHIAMKFSMTVDDINQNPEFKIGIPSEDESIPFMELFQMLMFGF